MSCDSEDEYNFATYTIPLYHIWPGLPLIKKKSRLIAAVVQNEVEILKDLLDSPKWYNVCDKSGYSLLQIAILTNNIEVFDYMLSIPDFPLEFAKKDGQTAFMVSLEGELRGEFPSEYFAYALIKKGISVKVDEQVLRDKIVTSRRTGMKKYYGGFYPLHRALDRTFVKVSKLIIESGIDINMPDNDGHTPLKLVSTEFSEEDRCEIISMLLVHGAVPTVDLFENYVLTGRDKGLEENLFLYVFDQHTTTLEFEINALLTLILTNSHLIDEIIKYPVKIKPNDGSFFMILCEMSPVNIKVALEKCNDFLCQAFSNTEFDRQIEWCAFGYISLENLDLLLESNLKSLVKDFIPNLDRFRWFPNLRNWVSSSGSSIAELYYYLLSHGLITIHSRDLHYVFSKLNGPCELFKFLLYMDVQLEPMIYERLNIMSVFFSDVTIDLDDMLKYPQFQGEDIISDLVKYFAHPKVKTFYEYDCFYKQTKRDIPEVPTLVELARNSFRKYFIQRFNITTCKQFYYLMDCLLISPVLKKIITYETELY